MSGNRVFVDTNIWLYALIETTGDDCRHRRARRCLENESNIVISTQVVNEVCVNLIRRADKSAADISRFVRDFTASYPVMGQEKDDLIQASVIRENYAFSYWDSLIVTAAINGGCQFLYSEDMQDGLVVFEQIEIRNPLI